MRVAILAAVMAIACSASAPQSPRAQLLEGAVGAGVLIYPQVLAHLLVSEGADVGAPKPVPVYLSRALCTAGKPSRTLGLGPELQRAIGDTARQLGRDARWVDSPALFVQPEAADSGDILVCFGPIELAGQGARVESSVVSRDGTREDTPFVFRFDGEGWVLVSS